jgi:hypothetical protein
MKRLIVPALGLPLLLSGCTFSDPAPAPAPTTVIVNTPSDSGTTVLLTVVLIVAVLAIIACAFAVAGWLGERRRRSQAEDMVIELTGVPVSRLHLSTARRAIVQGQITPEYGVAAARQELTRGDY